MCHPFRLTNELKKLSDEQLTGINGKLNCRYPAESAVSQIGIPYMKDHLEVVNFLANEDFVPFTGDGNLCRTTYEGDLIRIENTSTVPIRKAESIVLFGCPSTVNEYRFPITLPVRNAEHFIYSTIYTALASLVAEKMKRQWQPKLPFQNDSFLHATYGKTFLKTLGILIEHYEAFELMMAITVDDFLQRVDFVMNTDPCDVRKLQTEIVDKCLFKNANQYKSTDKRQNAIDFATSLKSFMNGVRNIFELITPPVYAKSEKIDSDSSVNTETGEYFTARMQNINHLPRLVKHANDEIKFSFNFNQSKPEFESYKHAYDFIQQHEYKPSVTQLDCSLFRVCKMENSGNKPLDLHRNSRVVLVPSENVPYPVLQSRSNCCEDLIQDFLAYVLQKLTQLYPDKFTVQDFNTRHDGEAVLYPSTETELLKLIGVGQALKNLGVLIGKQLQDSSSFDFSVNNRNNIESDDSFWERDIDGFPTTDHKFQATFSNVPALFNAITTWYGANQPKVVGIVHLLENSSDDHVKMGEDFFLRLV